MFLRAVQSWIEHRMRDLGVPEGRTGAVVCVQRYDSALRLDPHLHALVLDGVFTGLESSGSVEFHALPKPTDADIEGLVRSLHGRIERLLHRRGALCDEDGEEPGALALCRAASAQGRIPFGPG